MPTPPTVSITFPASAGETLTDLSTYASGTATAMQSTLNAFLQSLVEITYTPITGGSDLPVLEEREVNFDEQLGAVTNTLPTFTGGYDVVQKIAELAALEVPEAPDLNDIDVDIPVLDATAPTITLPSTPTALSESAPTDAPNIVDFAMPDAPTVTLPSVPSFADLQLPVVPTYELPTFTATAPTNNLLAPTNEFSYVDTGYTSTLTDPLVAKLLDQLQNGGYGIETADETALWNRVRDRETQLSQAEIAEVMRTASTMSFPLPHGALFAAVESARQKLQAALSSANRDIGLKRADMYVENRRFTFEQIQSYEKIARDTYHAVQERQLNAAKASVEMGIAVYEAAVKNYQAQLDGFRTEAIVFSERVKGELAKAELYKSQIQAEALRGQFNEAKTRIYLAQLDGIKTTVDIYRARMSAVETMAQIQAQKLQAFNLRVQAYSQVVQAKSAEYSMYGEAVRGQLAKLDVYKSEIAAYNAKVSGLETKADVLVKANTALVSQYNTQVTAYEGQLKSAVAQIEGGLDVSKTDIALYNAQLAGYRAFADTVIESVRSRVSVAQMNNERDKAVISSQIERYRVLLQQVISTLENQRAAGLGGTQVMTSMYGSILNAMSGLAVNTTSG